MLNRRAHTAICLLSEGELPPTTPPSTKSREDEQGGKKQKVLIITQEPTIIMQIRMSNGEFI